MVADHLRQLEAVGLGMMTSTEDDRDSFFRRCRRRLGEPA